MSTTKFYLKVFFILLCIRRLNFHILKLLRLVEHVRWDLFRLVKNYTLVCEKFLSELVARDDSEDVLAEIHVNADVKVQMSVVIISPKFF